ncbi:hypothetical protein ABPG75_011107 [Micractinium tetrahymenae]
MPCPASGIAEGPAQRQAEQLLLLLDSVSAPNTPHRQALDTSPALAPQWKADAARQSLLLQQVLVHQALRHGCAAWGSERWRAGMAAVVQLDGYFNFTSSMPSLLHLHRQQAAALPQMAATAAAGTPFVDLSWLGTDAMRSEAQQRQVAQAMAAAAARSAAASTATAPRAAPAGSADAWPSAAAAAGGAELASAEEIQRVVDSATDS